MACVVDDDEHDHTNGQRQQVKGFAIQPFQSIRRFGMRECGQAGKNGEHTSPDAVIKHQKAVEDHNGGNRQQEQRGGKNPF